MYCLTFTWHVLSDLDVAWFVSGDAAVPAYVGLLAQPHRDQAVTGLAGGAPNN